MNLHLLAIATSDSDRATIVLVGAGILWLLCATVTALFGQTRTYPFFPIFLCSLLIPFPIVLLVVTVAGQTHVNSRRDAGIA